MKLHHPPTSAHGYTIIELLMVITILSVIALIALPQLLGSREKAAGSACAENESVMRLELEHLMSAAADDGSGVLGINPRAEIYSIKTFNREGDGYLIDIIAGIDWAIGTQCLRKSALQLVRMLDANTQRTDFLGDAREVNRVVHPQILRALGWRALVGDVKATF